MTYLLSQIPPGAGEIPITLNSLVQVITTVGFNTGLILFFIWVGWKMIDRYSTRVEKLEDFIRTTLLEKQADTITAMTRNSEALRQNSEVIQSNSSLLARVLETSDRQTSVLTTIHDDLKTHHNLAVEIAKKMEP